MRFTWRVLGKAHVQKHQKNAMKTSFKLFALLVAATFAINQPLRAGTHTWSGVNDVKFNNASNWSYGGAPTAGTYAGQSEGSAAPEPDAERNRQSAEQRAHC